jgi:hypothetical protein
MCNQEKYQFIVCSQDRLGNDPTQTPTSTNNPNNCTFYVNWASVLPEKYKRFNVRWSFISGNADSSNQTPSFKGYGLVYANFFQPIEQFDTHTKSKNGLKFLGLIERCGTNNANTNYIGYVNSNPDFTMNRPTNNQLNIRVYSTETVYDNNDPTPGPRLDTPTLLTNAGGQFLQDWILTFEFTPIE